MQLVRVLCAALAFLAGVSSANAAEPRVLTLSDTSNPPFTNPEGTGIIDRVAGEAFRRAGLELHLIRVPTERAVLLADAGFTDGDMARIAGLEATYPNLIRVPENVTRLEAAAVSKNAAIPSKIEALVARDLGVIQGWKMYEPALRGARQILTVDDADQLFRVLQYDRVEVILFERRMAYAYIRKNAIANLHVLEPPLFLLPTYIYLHKRHAAYVPKIDAALRALKREGFYQRVDREVLEVHAGGSRR